MNEASIKKFSPPAVGVLAVLSFIYFGGFSQKDIVPVQTVTEKTIPLSIGQTQMKALVADTPALQVKGLGGRESIAADEGMLFLFSVPDFYSIWMKDMRFPIDVFWIDESRRVVHVVPHMTVASFPKIFTPPTLSRYVLEVRAGFAEKNGIKIGDPVSF